MIAENADNYNVDQWIWMPISSEKLINKRPKGLCNIHFVIMSFLININIIIFWLDDRCFLSLSRILSSPEPKVMELLLAGLIKTIL